MISHPVTVLSDMKAPGWGLHWHLQTEGLDDGSRTVEDLPCGIYLYKSEIHTYMVGRELDSGEVYPLVYSTREDLTHTVQVFLAGYNVGYLLGTQDQRERARDLLAEARESL